MKPCDQEQLVVETVMRGRLTPEVEAHLASCGACREIQDTVRSMSSLAAATERLAVRRRLPEAGQLWWKGQLTRRWEAEARAVAPLDMMQRLEIGAGLVAALVLLASFLGALTPAAVGAPGNVLSLWAGAANPTSVAVLATVAVTTVAASFFVLRRVLSTSS